MRPGKTEARIYDYADRAVPMPTKMFEKRLRGYRAIGYARDEAPLGLREENDGKSWNCAEKSTGTAA